MTEVQKIKHSLDPELYVKAVARWQKEDEAARISAGNVVSFTPAQPKPRRVQTPQKQEPDLGLRCTLAMFGVWVLTILALI